MFNTLRISTFFFITLFLANCYVRPVNYEFTPTSNFYTDDNGKNIAYLEDEDISIEINYEYHSNNEITFFAYFYNSSSKSIKIDLEDIILNYNYYSSSDIDYIPFNATKEIELIQNDFINLSVELIYKTYSHLDSLFNVVLSIKEGDSTKYSKSMNKFIVNQNKVYNNFLEKNQKVEEDDFFWRNNVLKSINLKPKEEIGGLLIFNKPNFKNRIRITIPILNKYYVFKFRLNEL